MGAPRHRPPVVPGPSLALLLLLLSGPAPGRASPRLLDHPAPVCSQQVRPPPLPAGAREQPGCCGAEGRAARRPELGTLARWAGSPCWGLRGSQGLGTGSGCTGQDRRSSRSCVRDPGEEGVSGEKKSRSACCTTWPASWAGGTPPPGPTVWGRRRGPGRRGGARLVRKGVRKEPVGEVGRDWADPPPCALRTPAVPRRPRPESGRLSRLQDLSWRGSGQVRSSQIRGWGPR